VGIEYNIIMQQPFNSNG